MDLIGKQCRLKTSEIKWYLDNEAYELFVVPGKLEADEEYDLSVENCLFMALFKDEYPATITAKSGENYRVEWPNGRRAYFGLKHLKVKP